MGFGYLSDGTGHHRIPHVGGCILEDEVEVGSNTCIDRGSIDDTVIGRGTKLDNLVQVGHNVQIGERCLIMAGVGIAGSTRIGNDVILAGHVGVTDHLVIGDRARIAAKSAIFGDVPAGRIIQRPSRRAAPAVPPGPGRHVPAGAHRGRAGAAGAGAGPAVARRTLARSACVSGIGLHTGSFVIGRVPGALRPARGSCSAEPTCPVAPVIPARLSEVQSTERRTALGQGETVVQTVEHLLAATAALQIDDLTIELDGPEPPIGDGSFAPYLAALEEAGHRGAAG